MKGPRVVITGYDDQGNSVWVTDRQGVLEARDGRPGSLDLWRIPRVPVPMDADGTSQEQTRMPPADGLAFKVIVRPPQSKSQKETSPVGLQTGGMHETETVDLVTMISGELWTELEGQEKQVLLKAGDILIQRGTTHAWHNKSDAPAVFSVVIVSAERSARTPVAKSGARSYRRGTRGGQASV